MNNRSPFWFGAAGCVVGLFFMVCFVAFIILLGPELAPISGGTYQTIIAFGALFVPIALGLIGYHWAKDRQAEQE